jgi:hypothetical protein
MRIIFIISVFIAAIRFQYFFIDAQLEEKPGNPKLEDSVLTATLCFVGDLMCHSTQFNYAKVDADSFDFTGVFREVKPYLSNADLTIVNLEQLSPERVKAIAVIHTLTLQMILFMH